MTDRYFVIGNPVAHSLSPAIHAAFARETGQDIVYDRCLSPLDGFAATVESLRAEGVRGANVTVPFKEDAYRLCTRLSERAHAAMAVNTLTFDRDEIAGDNTDGVGLVTDLARNLNVTLSERRILLLGAGGATRGVLAPLLAERPARLVIANRTEDKARALVAHASASRTAESDSASAFLQPEACGYAALSGQQFDLIVNGTSASLAGEVPPLPGNVFATGALAYDMMYGKGEQANNTVFLAWARSRGAARVADGLGMLVEQAAEVFYLWRGVRPSTAPVLASLR